MSNGVRDFWKRAENGIKKSIPITALKIREDIRTLILARQTPRGGRQKDNAALSDDGVLADSSKYRVIYDGPYAWVIHPPAERANVIQYLKQKGYVLFEIPKSAPKWLEEILKKEMP